MKIKVDIVEIEYSVSPGGVDSWEVMVWDKKRENMICHRGDFPTAGKALNWLVKHYPLDEIKVNVLSLSNFYATEDNNES